MISEKQMDAVVTLITAENKEEVLKYFVSSFCFNVENCNLMLSKIAEVGERINLINQERINQLYRANESGVAEVYWAKKVGKRRRTKDNSTRFIALMYMLIPQYPDGTTTGMSISAKNLFDEMLSYIKDGTGFDVNKESDWQWAFNVGVYKYIVNVVRNNIDKGFEIPCKINRIGLGGTL